ncbi:MAG TPA: TolC family protein [Gemmatimonadales bacterium]|nr:TolC family protein [Gemmatimonadales bacterium]HRZ09814.1 TolC family protein [Gemmatimonadales bacterium]
MRIAPRVGFCAVAVLWLFPGLGAAQTPGPAPGRSLTLAEARALARRQSPDLEAARQSAAAAAGRERQAGAWLNPTLSYGREQVSGGGLTNAQDIVSLEQPLELGGQRGARRESASFALAAAEARVALAEAQVDWEVARLYATAVASERRATLAEEAVAAFDRAVRTSEARLAGGDVSGYQHRRLALEAARYAGARLEARMARDTALQGLASLMGFSDSTAAVPSLQLVDTLLPDPLTVTLDSLLALALAWRPELLGARLEAEAGAADADLAAAERVPTPVLSGGYKAEEISGVGRLEGYVAGISIPLPLWDRRAGAVSAARAEADRRVSATAAIRRQTALLVRATFNAHQALAGELALLARQLGPDADMVRGAAAAAFAEGEMSLLEWLDAVRAYQEAESTYAMLWAEYIARRAALERATGASLF